MGAPPVIQLLKLLRSSSYCFQHNGDDGDGGSIRLKWSSSSFKRLHCRPGKDANAKPNWLVVSNMAALFSISYMGCHPNPIDELHHFSRWLLHHQPAIWGCKPLLSAVCCHLLSVRISTSTLWTAGAWNHCPGSQRTKTGSRQPFVFRNSKNGEDFHRFPLWISKLVGIMELIFFGLVRYLKLIYFPV